MLEILLSAATTNPAMSGSGRGYWLCIPGKDCVAEFKRLLESWESRARVSGDTARAADCRSALDSLQIALALES